MNIRKRILARKVTFAYYYMRYFWEFLPRQDWVLDDVVEAVKMAILKDVDVNELRELIVAA